MKEWEVIIADIPDNEKLIVELWFGDNHVLTISEKNAHKIVSIYQDGIDIPFEWLLEAMQVAKDRIS